MKTIPFIVAIDFDGTIKNGSHRDMNSSPVKGALDSICELYDMGCALILWTCRCGPSLIEATEYLNKFNVLRCFSSFNENYMDYGFGNDVSSKIYADIYIDDHAAEWNGWEMTMDGVIKRYKECGGVSAINGIHQNVKVCV